MKVFISWSGDRSRRVAELLDTWIKCTIQSCTPWISTRGIGRGELWFPAINRELAETSIGLVCLTAQNIDAPWILFEAGALAKGLDSNRVITLLIDISSTDIRDPLAQFNHTTPTKESMSQLLQTINSLSTTPLEQKIIEKVFDKYWDEFNTEFQQIITDTQQGPKPKKLPNEEMLSQILFSLRGLEKRIGFVERDNFNESNASIAELNKIVSILKADNNRLKLKNELLLKKYTKYKFGSDVNELGDNA
ncbi:hypothetical protein [Sphingobacterium multivorum]|uniref:hypothetical protein n=1 Tax=Sphingobacterium multivorum TaxID=28454 RepID=UPI0028AC838E|nr:hypothetical protein [Sphingobacterium multivorum]